MKYTEKDTKLLAETYVSSKQLGLLNDEILKHLLTMTEFQDKNKRSLIAKLGSMKIYQQDVKEKTGSKAVLVQKYIDMTGLPVRHFEGLSRLNIDTLEDMIEIEIERKSNVA